MTPAHALEIVRAYSDTLSKAGPPPGVYADVAKLPCDKARIRVALLSCIGSPAKEPYRSAMAALYLRLADFQHGIGQDNIAADDMAARGLGSTAARARHELERYRLDLQGVGLQGAAPHTPANLGDAVGFVAGQPQSHRRF